MSAETTPKEIIEYKTAIFPDFGIEVNIPQDWTTFILTQVIDGQEVPCAKAKPKNHNGYFFIATVTPNISRKFADRGITAEEYVSALVEKRCLLWRPTTPVELIIDEPFIIYRKKYATKMMVTSKGDTIPASVIYTEHSYNQQTDTMFALFFCCDSELWKNDVKEMGTKVLESCWLDPNR